MPNDPGRISNTLNMNTASYLCFALLAASGVVHGAPAAQAAAAFRRPPKTAPCCVSKTPPLAETPD